MTVPPFASVAPPPRAPRPPKNHRRRWPIVVAIVVVILIVVVVVAWPIGEKAARSYATKYAQRQLASSLGVASPSDVHVTLASGSIILQALHGRIDSLTATTDDASISGIHGALTLAATGVPVKSGQKISTVNASYTIPASQAPAIATTAGLSGATVTFASNAIHVTEHPKVFGIAVTVSAVVKATVSGGKIVFTPGDVTVLGGLHVPDSLVRSAIKTTSFCVNSTLPAGLNLTSVQVSRTQLSMVFRGANVDLSSRAKGQCS